MYLCQALIRDDEVFRFYRLNVNQEQRLVKKEKQILAAVVRNDVGTLRQLLYSSIYYSVTDKHGLNLIHIAILENSKEAFNYLLSLPDFPLELTSDYGETALITAILVIDLDNYGVMKPGDDYWAMELIKRGANIFKCDNFGYTTLSCAALKHHVLMAKLLIERGVDLDTQDVYGNTALHHALDHKSPNTFEFVMLLIHSGANLHIRNKDDLIPFEKSVFHCNDGFLEEIIFYHTYDEYSEMITHLSVLLRLARNKSPLLTEFQSVIVDESPHGGYLQLFYIDAIYLKILINKFKTAIAMILPDCSIYELFRNDLSFEKLEIFINSDLRDAIISCIQNEEDELIIQCLIEADFDEATTGNVVCYLLSYGLCLTDQGLQRIYQKFGYCELFKVLLHMDFEMKSGQEKAIMPIFLYDITMTLDIFLQVCDDELDTVLNIDNLLGYFVNIKLNDLCYKVYGTEIVSRIKKMPNVPLLVELARNTFRKYFIDRLGIVTSRQFYTYLNNLDISDSYKKIITYERKLY